MENGTETTMNGVKYIYINGAFFENEPMEGEFKDYLKDDILSIYKLATLLSGNRDYKHINF